MGPPVGKCHPGGLRSPRGHDGKGSALGVDDFVGIEKFSRRGIEAEGKHLVVTVHEQIVGRIRLAKACARPTATGVVLAARLDALFIYEPNARDLLSGQNAAFDELANTRGAHSEFCAGFGNGDAEHGSSRKIFRLRNIIMKFGILEKYFAFRRFSRKGVPPRKRSREWPERRNSTR